MKRSLTLPVECSGWILAGGAGRRIGMPKALLRLHGRSLVARTTQCLRQCGLPATVLGPLSLRPVLDSDGLPGVPILPDRIPGQGPLPAIASALHHSRTEWTLIVACDYPRLDPRLVHRLLEAAPASSADAILPISPEGRLQPLCGLYRARVRLRLRRVLQSGSSRVFDLLDSLHVETLPWRTLARAGCRPDTLLNLNRLDQLKYVLRTNSCSTAPPEGVPPSISSHKSP